jgi:hypothetical protein
MMTLKLWHALNHPPARHPLFQRLVLLPGMTDKRYFSWANILVSLVVDVGARSPVLLLFFLPLLLAFAGITYGIDCALRVGNSIARAYENETFDVLSLSPPGQMGITWALCTSSLYRHRDFDRLRDVMRSAIAFTFISLILIDAFISTINPSGFKPTLSPSVIVVMFHWTALSLIMVAIYVEYFQSAVLGSLVGMFVPTFARTRLDTGVLTFGGFLLLQMMVYFLTMLVGFGVLPVFINQTRLIGPLTEVGLNAVRLMIFFSLREALISILWYVLVQRLNTAPSELEFVIQRKT